MAHGSAGCATGDEGRESALGLGDVVGVEADRLVAEDAAAGVPGRAPAAAAEVGAALVAGTGWGTATRDRHR
jgi:hypothetical protein